VEIALGEEPAIPQRGRRLRVTCHIFDGVGMMRRITIPLQLAQIVLEIIDEGGTVLLYEIGTRGPDDHLRDADRVLLHEERMCGAAELRVLAERWDAGDEVDFVVEQL